MLSSALSLGSVSATEKIFRFYLTKAELLALTKGDISFENNQISITKTYYRTGRQDVITEPKTKQSVRTVEIPEFLKKEIKDFVDGHYGMPDDERLFPIVQEAVQHKMKRQIAKAGVKNIRVHDLSYPNLNKIQTFQKKDVNRNKYRLKRFGFYFWCMIPL